MNLSNSVFVFSFSYWWSSKPQTIASKQLENSLKYHLTSQTQTMISTQYKQDNDTISFCPYTLEQIIQNHIALTYHGAFSALWNCESFIPH